ncbi:MAG: sulfite exporter TauE/SafE family protein [Tepidiformaceae bacterium]
MELVVVLLTGLTAGGLTCLAVQGGLLASVMAAQSAEVAAQPLKPQSKSVPRRSSHAPVLAFLAAKLVAYTALGFLLGATGSLIGVSPTTRGWLQLFAGLYMVATALDLLQVHPIFRYVVLQPPAFLTRRVRRVSKRSDALAPALLGVMTVFIPCGTTLAVEFFALGTGSPIYAATLMFVFTLGTAPLFYSLGRLATGLSGERQGRFLGFTAAAVLLLGLLSVNTAMNLLNYPTYDDVQTELAAVPHRLTGRDLDSGESLPSADAFRLATPEVASFVPGGGSVPSVSGSTNGTAQLLHLDVTATAYSPNRLLAKAGQPIRLEVASNKNFGCTRGFTVPSLGVQKILPETGTVMIDLPAQKAGTIKFTCSMGMYSGTISVS